jgi:hypothetical protein
MKRKSQIEIAPSGAKTEEKHAHAMPTRTAATDAAKRERESGEEETKPLGQREDGESVNR